MDLIQNLKNQVKPLGKKVVLPEYQDERVLVATETILKEYHVNNIIRKYWLQYIKKLQ